MAKQTVNIGSAANDGTGDPLRTAFDKLNDNFDEVYADDFVVAARIADDIITEAHLDVTNSPVDGYVLTYDSASSGFTWEQKFDGDITGIVAGNGLTGDATSGDASLAVGAGTGITVNANDVQIADDGVDHTQLANRYTASGSITTYTGAVSVNWANATNYVMGSSLTGAIEFDFTGFKTGQVLTIHNLTGSQTITLDSDAATSDTFNKVGGNDYDGSSTNVLIVECIDDDATAVFNYSILTYTSDTTP
jgi:hypothetical protein